jgi:hypothetical protein
MFLNITIDHIGAGSTMFCICILCTNLLYPSEGTYLCCNVQSNVNNIGCNIGTADPSCEISSGKVRSLITLRHVFSKFLC